jgi:hypothetical protein
VTALFHDPTKYARIDENFTLEPIQYTRPKKIVEPPTNFKVDENLYFRDGIANSKVSLSWTPGSDFMARGYEVSYDGPDGFVSYGENKSTSVEIYNLVPGAYTFYVASVSYAGVASSRVSKSATVRGWEGTDPPYVSHLEIFNQGSDNIFSGQNCRISWRNNFPSSTFDVGQELSAGNGAFNPFYRDNIVRVYDTSTNTLLRSEILSIQTYTYTFEHNKTDNTRYGRGPQRSFRIEVTVRDNLGRESAPAKIVCTNPVPDLIIPEVRGGLNNIFINYVNPTDADFGGVFIWVSENRNFDPLATTPVYQGANNFVTIPADPGSKFKTYYVRIAAYDAFSTSNLNISPPISVQVGGDAIDVTSPDIPISLVLTGSIQTMPSGEVQTRLSATWAENSAINFAHFEIEIKLVGSNYVGFTTDTASYEWLNLVPNQSYVVRVRSVSKNGIKSAFSDEATIIMPKKTSAPGTPSGLTATASLKSVYLKWQNPTDTDLAETEIWFGLTSVLANAALIGKSKGTAFTHTGLTTGVNVNYWVRSVTTSGVPGAYSAIASVIPGEIVEADLASSSITAVKLAANAVTEAKIAASAITEVKIAPNSITEVKLAANAVTEAKIAVSAITEAKIAASAITEVKITSNAITAAKIAANSVVADKIAANAITAEKITALAIVADKIAANAVISEKIDTDAITANKIAALAVTADKIATNSVTSDKIAANAIVAAKIAASAITADKIAASAITADKIVAGTITGDKIAVNTSLPTTIVVGTSGVSIGELTDPAAFINSHATKIDPGRITVSGSSTLASWRDGTDQSKIAGGAIQANTIDVNKIVIGSRGLTIAGLQFSYVKATNVLSWSAGSITYTNDSGIVTTAEVTAGSVTWTSGTIYVAWEKDATVLTSSTTPLASATYVMLATYRGGFNLVANYGRTIIDGSNIVTGSITANQLQVAQLITESVQIKGGIITNTHLAGTITFDKLAGGTLSTSDIIRIGGDSFTLDAVNQVLTVKDNQAPAKTRLRLGKLGLNATDYGIEIYNAAGALILSSTGISGLSAISANLGTITSGVLQSSDGKSVFDLTNGTLIFSD